MLKNIDLSEVFWKAIGVTLVAPVVGAAVIRVIDVTRSVIKTIKG